MRGNNLNDLKKNINHAEDKNKTDSGEKIAPIGRNLCIALVALCVVNIIAHLACLLYTSPSPRDLVSSRMPSSA